MDPLIARNSQRIDLHVEVELTVGSERLLGTSRNLSLGGMFVEVAVKAALGERVRLKFSVATQPAPIEVGAVVRWADGAGVGVQFDGLRARDVWALGKLFEQPR